ncbi:MAG: hypothetical protein F6K18_25620 [Okeania sp. SIO2C2]|uniref:phage tail protein n=1 Tax=unclassified Okeania TaxID=2634635 RepID=UPI0013BCB142|nr:MULTISPECIES: phage tail protein [unclassified Okeania]NEP06968.1 hypothetical protein [Okeania sp. SIO4D6]NEP73688.1 hypothetical protein [Okeania sp. SIO2G5]NEP89929.1 hypothetical protein [Okeania sp. SIO2C2]NEP94492.1 hypothetical protein [Okeania sp. SIO2F5]NEQ92111.1 hypothetical protein [Okeania sp. SIO2G4]
MTNLDSSPSKLLDYLPEIYQSDPFIGQFLLPFEEIIFGSLEAPIADIHTYFDSQQTPPDFLPWLSSWVGLSLRADLDIPKQREFIANTVERYRYRGTKANLQALLELFLDKEYKVTITDTSNAEFQIGDSQLLNQVDNPEELPPRSLLGRGTYLGGGIPHFFIVRITPAKGLTQEQLNRQIDIAIAIIEQEKPAHTNYRLEIIYSMQIGTYDPNSRKGTGSQIGIDTVFGNIPENYNNLT